MNLFECIWIMFIGQVMLVTWAWASAKYGFLLGLLGLPAGLLAGASIPFTLNLIYEVYKKWAPPWPSCKCGSQDRKIIEVRDDGYICNCICGKKYFCSYWHFTHGTAIYEILT